MMLRHSFGLETIAAKIELAVNKAVKDNIRTIDGLVGKVLEQLKEDGLLENTFVFYFADHGGVLPLRVLV